MQPAALLAQTQPDQKAEQLKTLNALIESIDGRKRALDDARRQHQATTDPVKQATLTAQIDSWAKEVAQLESKLESVATGIDQRSYAASSEHRFDLAEEVEGLLRPLIEELKSATAGPREVERLRAELATHEERRRLAQQAASSIRDLLQAAKQPATRATLERLEAVWNARRADAINNQSVARVQLLRHEQARESVFESTRKLVATFFRSRGRNLLFAVGAFALVFFVLRLIGRRLQKIAHRQDRSPSLYRRLFRVLYHFAVVSLATVAAVMVLYAAGDWVLLGIVILFVLGIIWATKHLLPSFIEEVRLLLNIGPVREGELVIHHGLPWRIERLSYYARLKNPALTGGQLRLPVRDLLAMRSRPCQQNEPWFPCQEGDWVMLGDGTRGKVVTQTPDVVQLVELGGSRATYVTTAFLQLSPKNHSLGFRIRVAFGVDYKHQAEVTGSIPGLMQSRVLASLQEFAGAENVRNVAVELETANASSLDLVVLADFAGAVAERYDALRRRVQQALVDACNEHGWVIPFTQLTVHRA